MAKKVMTAILAVCMLGSLTACNGEEVKDVLIPNTVSSISNYAFYNCEKISSLTISESVKSIGYNAFAGCKKTGLDRLQWS